MNDLITLYSDLKREIQGIKTTLIKLTDFHAKRLIEEWVRKEEAMKVLGISARTLNRLLATGQLPFSKVKGIVYIKTINIENLLTTNFHQEMDQLSKK